ncbi:sugar ABC transporter substrate-binding protein [Paenibacillus sambharensis]|uniref:Sugar ABC transporter substrate-binding protein n=1 Tax=Paenibacillus sambharensis TaxID=1803190 RepID=A0A2W1LUJ5_9BACL|nr:substrate-binding domain-containing protein [Paenibacillus sambharensis]PZD95451.1 sugar ABC transporter substrate-binding protein [Paenibacillus sambharensis]
MSRQTSGRWLLRFLTIGLLAGMSACGLPQLERDEPAVRQITLIAPVHADELGDAMRLGAEAAAKEFGAELSYAPFKPEEGSAAQLKAAVEALKGGTDALLIDPADSRVLDSAALQAADHGVPVFILNDNRSADGVQASISVDNEEAGRKAGLAMAELLGEKGTVVVLGRQSDDPDLVARELGIVNALNEQPHVSGLIRTSCGEGLGSCRSVARQLLREGQAEGIIALDAQASLAAAAEAEAADRAGRMKIVTFGNELKQLELLQDGLIHTLIVQNGFSIGYLGVKQAVLHLAGEDIERSTRLDTKVINAGNMFWMDNQKLLFPFG